MNRTLPEKQLWQSRKMEAVGRLAGKVAHDFNNILTGIMGYTALALTSTKENSELREELLEIKNAGERAAELTRQLLTLSQKHVFLPKIINLNTIVKRAEKILPQIIGKDIKLITELDPKLWPVILDEEQMEYVMINLGIDARDAMPHGGQLHIKSKNLALGDNAIKDHFDIAPGRYVHLSVKDNGVGVGKENGLSLAAVFETIKQSGGSIFIASKPIQGTTLDIYLPALKSSVHRKSAKGREQVKPGETAFNT